MLRFTFASASIFIFSCLAYAEDKDAKFNEHKQHILKSLDEQISTIQTAKECVNSATSHAAMKSCHEALEKARKQHHLEALDKKIHHLEEEKKTLEK